MSRILIEFLISMESAISDGAVQEIVIIFWQYNIQLNRLNALYHSPCHIP